MPYKSHAPHFILCCILSSALLFSVGFLVPDYFWWTSLAFLIPVFYVFYTQAYTLSSTQYSIYGFLWGLCAFGIHSGGIFYSVARMADTQPWYLPLLCLAAIVYLALYSSVWFGLSSLFIRLVYYSPLLITVSMLSITLMYFFALDQLVFWPLQRLEGYPLVHPLLPFSQYPQLLMPLRFLDSFGMLAILVLIQAFFAQALVTRSVYTLSIISVLLVLWLYTSLLSTPEQPPDWLSRIVVLAQAFYNPDNPQKTIGQVTKHLKIIQAHYPHARVFIMPESALFLCNLLAQPDAITAYSAVLHPENTFITGGLYVPHTTQQTKHYNTLYVLDSHGIRTHFCKRHAMIFTEQLSSFWNITPLHNLYYTKRPAITPAQNKRPVIQLMPQISVVPYICSELFFNYYPDDTFITLPILALCNDSWLIPQYAKKLMYLYAHFKALVWQRPIIYVAYDYAYYLDKNIRQPLIRALAQNYSHTQA
jgi:apolipoprotein N-acyltransferase